MKLLAMLFALILLTGCTVVGPQVDKLHNKVFGCPPVDGQSAPCEKVPNMEKILDLPKCDNPQPVYPGARCLKDITLPLEELKKLYDKYYPKVF